MKFVSKFIFIILTIQAGRERGDEEIGKSLIQCMSQFSEDDMKVLETTVKENF